MATIKVRFLVKLRGRQGGLPRYYWQPSTPLRALGYANRRIPADFDKFIDPAALEGAAIAAATRLNAAVDADQRQRAAAIVVGEAGSRVVVLPPRPRRTVGALIDLYRAAPEWRDLRPRTRIGYNQCLDRIAEWAKAEDGTLGAAPVASVSPKRWKYFLHTLDRTPAMRNAVGRMGSILFGFGVSEDWLTVNPAAHMGLAEPPALAPIWPRDAVPHFVATADKMGLYSIGTAIVLNEWLGQREADILRMPPQVFRQGMLMLRQAKTAASAPLPVSVIPHLEQRLQEELARGRARAERLGLPAATTILTCDGVGLPHLQRAVGKPWKGDHFRHAFDRVRAEAALTRPTFALDYLRPGRDMTDHDAFEVKTVELIFMRLRHTAITRLAESSCTKEEIASVTRHSLATVDKVMKYYLVSTATIATHAFEKRARAEGLALSPPAADKEQA